MESIVGVLHSVGAVVVRTATLRTRDLVLRVASSGGRWCEYLPFRLINDDVAQVDGLRAGETVEVSFVVSGRPGRGALEGRYFNSLGASKVVSLDCSPAARRSVVGTLHRVGEVRGPVEGFAVREFVLRVSGVDVSDCDYLPMELRQGAVGALDGLAVGDRVEVLFVITGKEGKDGRCFNHLEALGVARV